MDWIDIINETGIEVIWVGKEYSEAGSYIQPCTLYPKGAIVLCLSLEDYEIEYVALHEIGHLVKGRPLTLVNERLKHLEHCKNEASANRYLLHKKAKDFVEANDYNRTWANPYRLCEYLDLQITFENIKIAQDEIDSAFWEMV